MATVQRCDRCLKDVTGKTSAAVLHCADVDEEHGGKYDEFDLCPACFRSFLKGFKSFMASARR